MKRLYDLGYSIATSDNPWQKEIPIARKSGEFIWTPYEGVDREKD